MSLNEDQWTPARLIENQWCSTNLKWWFPMITFYHWILGQVPKVSHSKLYIFWGAFEILGSKLQDIQVLGYQMIFYWRCWLIVVSHVFVKPWFQGDSYWKLPFFEVQTVSAKGFVMRFTVSPRLGFHDPIWWLPDFFQISWINEWFFAWKFNSSPLKINHPKRKFIFQPSCFRGS